MSLFYIFANLFNVWLNRGQPGSHIFLHFICCDMPPLKNTVPL